MKIKFKSDNDLLLNKTIGVHMLTIIFKFVFEEDGKYYPHVFLDDCLCEV